LKGLLKLDGPIIPIISSMVRQDEEINKLLDDSESIHEFKGKIKEKLSECLNYDGNLKDKFYSLFKKESVFPEEDNISDENEIKSSTSSDDYSDEINSLRFKENKVKKNYNKKENPLDDLMERIGNPLKRLKQILSLMKKVIKIYNRFYRMIMICHILSRINPKY
jgi:vacuolar-type H+-ATPase subunit I/STV1